MTEETIFGMKVSNATLEDKLLDDCGKLLKIVLSYLESTNPNTHYIWLKPLLKPDDWEAFVHRWEKMKSKIEFDLNELQHFKKLK